jgi:hypothetical protein
MSPERNEEMPAEFEMSDGMRGKYVERYRLWANRLSITAATGTIEVRAVTSASGASRAEIVRPQMQIIYATGPVLEELRPVIALEESIVARNAI